VKPIAAEELFLTNLCLIDKAIGYVCHRNRVDRDDQEEFGSYVKLKLIESNYAIICKFEGRCAFPTYITTVIQRLFFQYRVQMWGKWRPSAQARRLGDKGITLERLLTRDGYTYGEAVAVLTGGRDAPFTAQEIESIYLRLPVRQPRPVLVAAMDAAEKVPAAEQAMFSGERAVIAQHTVAAVDAAIATMEAEDQLILHMRFWNARTIPQIARALKIDGKKLYKRIAKLLAKLKLTLEGAGVGAADARELLEHPDHELAFEFPAAAGKTDIRHSKPLDAVGAAKGN
jgi:RNA polymerase sigma factor (sigma-70 family)